jgi:probable phosphomutase (TIGR03848 family)
VTIVLLVRHGRSTANTSGVLAGWTPEVYLDDVGKKQAETLARRLTPVKLSRVVSSPLERTRQTADALVSGQKKKVTIEVDDRVGECRYGDWTGRSLSDLVKEPLWKTVQAHPSSVTAIHEWNHNLGPRSIYAIVSHGDVIKAILADALGMHLDQFQRLQVDPCSLSVINYTPQRPFVLRMNDSGCDLDFIKAPKKNARGADDAAVGGGAGHTPTGKKGSASKAAKVRQ